jgi:uncharacterized protein (DUF488 family)
MDLAGLPSTVFTIGHSNRDLQTLVDVLQRRQIQVLVDVRSVPYSRFNPQFDREALMQGLQKAKIRYTFAGESLGGRPKDPTCYKAGILPEGKADYLHLVDYAEVAHQDWYLRGIDRLLEIACQQNIVILCSEGDPYKCHRHYLIAKTLLERGVTVRHILNESGETHILTPGYQIATIPYQPSLFD